MSEKLCIFCKHFDFDMIDRGPSYSEYTAGDLEGGMTCRKNHYAEVRPDSREEFRATLLLAQECADYKLDNG